VAAGGGGENSGARLVFALFLNLLFLLHVSSEISQNISSDEQNTAKQTISARLRLSDGAFALAQS